VCLRSGVVVKYGVTVSHRTVSHHTVRQSCPNTQQSRFLIACRRLEKLVLTSIFDTSLSSLMMWNLQSYPTTVLNERMWRLRGSKHNSDPSYEVKTPIHQDIRPLCRCLTVRLSACLCEYVVCCCVYQTRLQARVRRSIKTAVRATSACTTHRPTQCAACAHSSRHSSPPDHPHTATRTTHRTWSRKRPSTPCKAEHTTHW